MRRAPACNLPIRIIISGLQSRCQYRLGPDLPSLALDHEGVMIDNRRLIGCSLVGLCLLCSHPASAPNTNPAELDLTPEATSLSCGICFNPVDLIRARHTEQGFMVTRRKGMFRFCA